MHPGDLVTPRQDIRLAYLYNSEGWVIDVDLKGCIMLFIDNSGMDGRAHVLHPFWGSSFVSMQKLRRVESC